MLSKVVYFSRKHENLMNGKTVELAEGNTQVIAKKIGNEVHCDVVELSPLEKYPKRYPEMVEVAEKERQNQDRPLFHKVPEEVENERILFLGFPNWCGGMPMIVANFLETYEMSDKIIYPFCTHEGSAFGNSLFELKKLCPQARIMTGLAVHGSKVHKADKAVKNWLIQYEKMEEQYHGKK